MADLLAIDYGRKRVGLARGNTEAKIAAPLESWPNDNQLIPKLKEFCVKHRITTVVIGFPRSNEGQETAQTALVKQFAEELKREISVTVHFQDESLTSVQAYTAGVADVDSEAARIFLQDYLDSI